jgi:hypothetical protein
MENPMGPTSAPRSTAGLLLAAAVFASGCQRTEHHASVPTPAVDGKQLSAATRLLKAGDTGACSSDAVRSALISAVLADWLPENWTPSDRNNFLALAEVSTEETVASYVDATLPTMSCDATFYAKESSEAWESRITYTLNLDLDAQQVRVTVPNTQDGVAALDGAATDYDRRVIVARRINERDAQLRPICAEYEAIRGSLDEDKLQALVDRAYAVQQQYGLPKSPNSCERDLNSSRHAAFNARLQRQYAEGDRQLEAERAERERPVRKGDRVEYTGPPTVGTSANGRSPTTSPTARQQPVVQ